MVNVIKRDCSVVEFDHTKIYNAIVKAMKYGSGIVNEKLAMEVALEIYAESLHMDEIDIYSIESMVFKKLIEKGHWLTAKAYEGYRKVREYQREESSTTDSQIKELLEGTSDYWNNENSNKNARLLTTQRDYMAGILSTDITRRFLLPPDVVQAHDEGIIHFHDADYFAQNAISNCFSGDTEFVTDYGVKKFSDFYDGDIVKVKDMYGEWKEAVVHTYGKQKMFDITFKTPRSTKTVTCTKNHRWILKDGSVTTELKVGDSLYGLRDTTDYVPTTMDEIKAYTYGFILGDGRDVFNSKGKFCSVNARLCGKKTGILPLFIKAGYIVSPINNSEDVVVTNRKAYSKQEFLNSCGWRLLRMEEKIALFHGYYAADGFKDRKGIATADIRLSKMIEELSAMSGYYIASKNDAIRTTNYKEDSRLITYRFIVKQPDNWLWKVVSIEPHFKENGANTPIASWCVEEPTTHTFTLANGMVTGNCCLINLEDMLQNGTVINKVMIEKPHRFITAMTIATQIITAVTSSQYGGATITLTHLAPFIRDSYKSYFNKYKEWGLTDEQAIRFASRDIKKEISDGVQTFNYQCNSMTTTNGQSPFLSVCMYLGETEEYKDELALLIEEFLKQRIVGMKNEQGVYVTQAFPKLLYVLEEDNIRESSRYWYLTELAAECTAKRLVPDYISEKIMRREKEGNTYPCMGCRSFLTPYYEDGKPKFYGRFNQGVVTLNLVDVALSSDGDIDKFWDIFEERTELCHKALRCRHERLLGTLSDVAPIIWQNGAFARLEKGQTIDALLYNGYSTISLGYAGLYECVKYMTGESHSSGLGKTFGMAVMTRLNEKCRQWRESENIHYSLYGSPIESTTYKFAKCLKKRFGEIKGITDRDYITNSYHIPVFEEIDPFSKLYIEADFQKYSPGGAISYVETADMTRNNKAVLEVIRFIYDNIMYAELNTKSDYCQVCGYDGEIKIVSENNDLIWECPNCGNRDKDKMNVARRTCGYIGANFWNKGRTEEINERYVHLDDHICEE